jgi:hypothetical protein
VLLAKPVCIGQPARYSGSFIDLSNPDVAQDVASAALLAKAVSICQPAPRYSGSVIDLYAPDAVLAVTSVLPAKPRMRDLIHDKWLMMTGITEFLEEGQSRHPSYRMYKHDHPFFDGVNAWVRWFWDRKYKLVMESQFVLDNNTRQRSRIQTIFYS